MTSRLRRFAWYAIATLSTLVAAYAAVAYTALPLGALVHPDMKASFNAHALGIRIHVFAAIAALALGPWQFSAALRRRRPEVHRWMGRAYLGIGVGLGGASGLYMAQFAHGGPVAQAGFTTLALAWLYTGWAAYGAIRRGDVPAHREWMVRNFALALGAVTLRILLPSSMLLGIGFEEAYRAIAWLCPSLPQQATPQRLHTTLSLPLIRMSFTTACKPSAMVSLPSFGVTTMPCLVCPIFSSSSSFAFVFSSDLLLSK